MRAVSDRILPCDAMQQRTSGCNSENEIRRQSASFARIKLLTRHKRVREVRRKLPYVACESQRSRADGIERDGRQTSLPIMEQQELWSTISSRIDQKIQ